MTDNYNLINADAENVAKAIFDSIGEPTPSILSLVRWIEENFGIKIKIEFPENFSIGYSGYVYPDPTSGVFRVGINAKDADCRQRFTECHELAHIVRNFGLKYGFSTGEIYTATGLERFCDRFAAAFLMPESLFIEKWESFNDDIWKKARMANYFKVSGEAVRYRLKDLGIFID